MNKTYPVLLRVRVIKQDRLNRSCILVELIKTSDIIKRSAEGKCTFKFFCSDILIKSSAENQVMKTCN